MKSTTRDYLTVAAAFLAVFLCGYGVGHLVCEWRAQTGSVPPEASRWEDQALDSMQRSLSLRPEQLPAIRKQLESAAAAIQDSHDAVLVEDLRHILRLYEQLIPLLDDEQARKLDAERFELEKRIKTLDPNRPSPE